MYLLQPASATDIDNVVQKRLSQTGSRTELVGLLSGVWNYSLFLPRDAMRKRGVCCSPVSVCLSVCHVQLHLQTQFGENHHTAADIVKLLSRPGSSIILVFLTPALVPNSNENPFSGAQNTLGGKILRFSTEIVIYLGNGTR